jgi:hypothetical protein
MEDDASITIGPLKIWTAGRQFPDSRDYWDGNWLSVTARCEGAGSRVEVSGAFLHLGELKKWKEEIEAFQRTLKGSVALPTIEPTLKVKIDGTPSVVGHFSVEVEITGEHMTEQHRFQFTSDQFYLPGLLTQLALVFREYPVRT